MTKIERVRLESRVRLNIARGLMAKQRRQCVNGHPLSSFLANSLPKAGTHLLVRVLEEMSNIRQVRFQPSGFHYDKFRPKGTEPRLELGVAWPLPVSRRRVARALRRLPGGTFVTAHVPHTRDMASLMRDLSTKMVLIVRDPRDVAVSSGEYWAREDGHPLAPHFQALSPPERLRASLLGVAPTPERQGLRDIGQRLGSVIDWQDEEFVHVTRFEDLVGPLGGGSRERQLDAIQKIGLHVHNQCSASQAERIAERVFGGTAFRKGQIGGWRERFDESHLLAAKPLLGDALIRLNYEVNLDWAEIRPSRR